MDSKWNPMKEDHEDPSFNCYDRGPAKGLVQGQIKEKAMVELYVGGIPRTLTDEGLCNLFSSCGQVDRASVKKPKQIDSPVTYGFVRFSNPSAALKGIETYNKFKIENGKYQLTVHLSDSEEAKRKKQVKALERFNCSSDDDDYLDRSKDSLSQSMISLNGLCCLCKKQAKSRCSKCKVFYCSAECQRMDWKAGHKLTCKQLSKQVHTVKIKESVAEIKMTDTSFLTNGASPPVKTSPVTKPDVKVLKRPKLFDMKRVELKRDETVEVLVVNFTCPKNIYINLHSSQSVLSKLSVNLEQYVTGLPPQSYVPEEDEICAVLFQCKNQWLRAVMIQANLNGTILVQSVDYGIKEDVHVANIRHLVPHLCELPLQAIYCGLPIESNLQSTWDDQVYRIMEEAGFSQTNKVFRCLPRKRKSGYYTVEIIDPETNYNVCHDLVTQGLAVLPGTVSKPNESSKVPDQQTVQPPSTAEVSSVSTTEVQPPPIAAPPIPTVQKYLQKNSINKLEVLDLVSPSQFYAHIQNVSRPKELEALMVEMNSCYEQKAPKKGFKPNANKLYACKYSGDNRWYRALVYDFNAVCCSVFYLDYGNYEQVPFHHLHSLESSFSSLPFQAVCCKLAGVMGTEPDGKWTADAKTVFCQQVAQGAVVAAVVDLSPGQISVEITLGNGSHLTDLLLQQGLAVKENLIQPSSVQESVKETYKEQSVTPPVEIPKDITSMSGKETASVKPAEGRQFVLSDLPHLVIPDQTLVLVVVTDAANPDDITVQILEPCIISQIQTVITTLQEKYINNPGGFNPSKPGVLVAAKYSVDQTWYRGLVTSINGQVCKVLFIDYGNEEELEISNLALLDTELTKYPIFGVKCTLTGDSYKLAQDKKWDPELVVNKQFAMTIFDKSAIKKNVILYDENEKPISKMLIEQGIFVSSVEQKKLPFYSPMSNPVQCTIVHFVSPWEFYVHILETELLEKLTYVMQEVNTMCKLSQQENPQYLPTENEIVGVFFEADDCWYRCQVISVDGMNVKVHFVDFGNTEIVTINHVQKLDNRFDDYPQLALRCSLGALTDNTCRWAAIRISYVEELLKDKQVMITFEQTFQKTVEDALVVCEILMDIDGKSTKLSEHLIQDKKMQPETLGCFGKTSKKVMNELPPQQHLPSTAIEVAIQEILSPHHFYINIMEDWAFTENQQMLLRLNEVRSKLVPCDEYCENDLVIAKYEEVWYRAVISNVIKGPKYEVFFIDFGNSAVVDEVYKLPEEFHKHPMQAICCELSEVKPVKQWSTEAITWFKGFEQKVVQLKVIEGGGVAQKHKVDLIVHGKELSQIMIEEGLAERASEPVKNDVPPPIVCEAEKFTCKDLSTVQLNAEQKVMVTEILSVKEFYCQVITEQIEMLFSLSEKWRVYCLEKKPCTDVKQGDLCFALYSGDNDWYRAVVLDALPNDIYRVQMIDWGTTDQVQSIHLRAMDKSFLQLPAQAVKCALKDVKPGPDALNSFQSLAKDKVLDLVLESKDDQLVTLIDQATGVNINEALQPKVAQPTSLEEENLQLKQQIQQMQEMMTKLLASQK